MTTYYLSPTGNNSTGAGTSGNPWQTLSRVAPIAVSGDVVQLAAGTYPAETGLTVFAEGVTIQGAGKDSTIVQFTVDLFTQGMFLWSSVIKDLHLYSTYWPGRASGYTFSVCVGYSQESIDASGRNFWPTSTKLYRVRCTSPSDNILFSCAKIDNSYLHEFYAEDCEFNAEWDTYRAWNHLSVAPSTRYGTMNAYFVRCTWNVDGVYYGTPSGPVCEQGTHIFADCRISTLDNFQGSVVSFQPTPVSIGYLARCTLTKSAYPEDGASPTDFGILPGADVRVQSTPYSTIAGGGTVTKDVAMSLMSLTEAQLLALTEAQLLTLAESPTTNSSSLQTVYVGTLVLLNIL